MISPRSVIRMKVPFGDEALAGQRHMYVCVSAEKSTFSFVKCQTLKPYMVFHNPMVKYIDEGPDRNRNPFHRTTRIDCDKLFLCHIVSIPDSLLTTVRDDVCQDLFDEILEQISDRSSPTQIIEMDELVLATINTEISIMKKTAIIE